MNDEIGGWFAGRLPDDWFEAAPEVTGDRDEILVVGRLADVDLGADASEDAANAARLARIKRFREDTRNARMAIADEAERLFRRKVAWGAECGGVRRVFTNMAIPVMTRLRLRERAVLDTLIDAGVARSRSEALAWCVRLVGKNESEWIDSLRDALAEVEKARAQGPAA
ncbi:MAG TPA: hypothetical protein VHI71_09180 [Actinomycetota bacterium]|nr:hypothetical protein [Actinomycetota bacterium]